MSNDTNTTNISVKDAAMAIYNQLGQMKFSLDDEANLNLAKSARNLAGALVQWAASIEQKAEAKAAEEAEAETEEAPAEEAAEG
ncbi:MAG: hypothetical protein E7327_08830 [Clostridiales bacterium]|nr:hypothetical protein [Clostridiales bacterium]